MAKAKKSAVICSIMMLLMIAISISLSGCPEAIPTVVVSSDIPGNQPIVFDEKNVLNEGNNTYIAINIVGLPSDNVTLILKIMKKFEDTHPELTVTSWSVLEGQTTQALHGIWVHHMPKPE